MTNDTQRDNISLKNDSEIEEIRNTVRFQAVKILNRYERSSAYLEKLLQNSFKQYEFSKQDKALLTEIVYGTVRWKAKLDWILTGFFHGDFNKCINPIKNTMRIGLYQILHLDRVPEHASINESVEIAKRIQSQKTAGLVNGVLRNIARNQKNIRYPNPSQDFAFFRSVVNSYPKWMVENWFSRFGEEDAEKLMEAMNQKPRLGIRINRLKHETVEKRKELLSKMKESGYSFELIDGIEGSFYLESSPGDITQNQYFENGDIIIQDPSSSLIPLLANPNKGQIIADMCAAPGGKSVMMAELMGNQGKISAYDQYEAKLSLIEGNSQKMGISIIEASVGDATKLKISKAPNIILADVPCSGTGTIQKHPELKWSLEKDSIKKLNKIQRSILSQAAKNLEKDGVLIYSTCSIEKAENQDIVEEFLSENPDFSLEDAGNYIDPKFVRDGYLELLPHKHNTMGAFGARLIKNK